MYKLESVQSDINTCTLVSVDDVGLVKFVTVTSSLKDKIKKTERSVRSTVGKRI